MNCHTRHIDTLLRPLAEEPLQAYLSETVQVADLLWWILRQIGKSTVWQSTFSISEEFLRRLVFLDRQGLIAHMTLVLDMKATQKTLSLWPFIRQTINEAYLADNHSKIVLARSLKGDTALVVTSQNLTRGNRHECAVVAYNSPLFATMLGQFRAMLNNKAVPFNDIYARTIG